MAWSGNYWYVVVWKASWNLLLHWSCLSEPAIRSRRVHALRLTSGQDVEALQTTYLATQRWRLADKPRIQGRRWQAVARARAAAVESFLLGWEAAQRMRSYRRSGMFGVGASVGTCIGFGVAPLQIRTVIMI